MEQYCEWCGMQVPFDVDGRCFLGHSGPAKGGLAPVAGVIPPREDHPLGPVDDDYLNAQEYPVAVPAYASERPDHVDSSGAFFPPAAGHPVDAGVQHFDHFPGAQGGDDGMEAEPPGGFLAPYDEQVPESRKEKRAAKKADRRAEREQRKAEKAMRKHGPPVESPEPTWWEADGFAAASPVPQPPAAWENEPSQPAVLMPPPPAAQAADPVVLPPPAPVMPTPPAVYAIDAPAPEAPPAYVPAADTQETPWPPPVIDPLELDATPAPVEHVPAPAPAAESRPKPPRPSFTTFLSSPDTVEAPEGEVYSVLGSDTVFTTPVASDVPAEPPAEPGSSTHHAYSSPEPDAS